MSEFLLKMLVPLLLSEEKMTPKLYLCHSEYARNLMLKSMTKPNVRRYSLRVKILHCVQNDSCNNSVLLSGYCTSTKFEIGGD